MPQTKRSPPVDFFLFVFYDRGLFKFIWHPHGGGGYSKPSEYRQRGGLKTLEYRQKGGVQNRQEKRHMLFEQRPGASLSMVWLEVFFMAGAGGKA